jgi:hypothetical protein
MSAFPARFLLLSVTTACAQLIAPASVSAEDISFNMDIRPILSDKCYFCHGPDAKDIKGDLQLHTFEKATSDRNGKGPALVPGKPEKSLLWERITQDDPDEVMPPPERHMKITEDEQRKIRAWIEQGGEYEALWSLRPLPDDIPVPSSESALARNPVDHFIQRTLDKHGLTPSPEADKETLLRRVHLALTGLLPTAAEVKAFLSDHSEDAYEKVVDRLLDSQAYAEHMTVEWMDVARYADSYGYQVDRPRQVWPWRDWVLRAFRSNKPFDDFITEQLAGDLLENADDQTILATAFNRLHGQKVEGGSIPEEFRTEYVADRAQTVATAFLGLTMECARCHDHKYDPLSMKDYYSLFAFFNNIDEAGLYSYFTRAVPSPSMPVLDHRQKDVVASKELAVKEAERNLLLVSRKQKEPFMNWREGWNGQLDIPGMIAAFRFDSDAGGRLTEDVTGKSDIKLPKGAWLDDSGPGNRAVRFDGDTELELGAIGPFERHEPFSFSLQINPAEAFSRAVILHRSKAWTDAASRGYELLIHEGHLDFALVHFSPGNEIRIRTKDTVKVGDWSRVTATYDGSSTAAGMRLYINGEIAETEVVRDHLTKEIWYSAKRSMPVKLAARFRDSGFKQSGIDDVIFWSRELSPLEAKAAHTPDDLSPSDEALYDYYLKAASSDWRKAFDELTAARKDLNEFLNNQFYMMVMNDLPEPRPTYVLNRGLYSDPDPERPVSPAPPADVFPFDDTAPRNRLGLAQWLTDPHHPLTSRVTVNRYWQMIFGEGIVPTANDFGFQGDLPSHPDLLDYLSRYFIDSGWDVHALLKHMVMSHTFRQRSVMSDDIREKDPHNRFLACGPSHHMTAEMLRDNALHASGNLDPGFGGKPVKASSDRRSLYVEWKRSEPEPVMLIFGKPPRNVCSVKREKTSTPLQALVLLNSPQYVKASCLLAEELLEEFHTDEERLQEAFIRLASRSLDQDELAVMRRMLQQQKDHFEQMPEQAENLLKASGVKGGSAGGPELAALTMVVNAVMNLDAYYMIR